MFDWWVPGTITNAQKTLEYGLVVEKDMRDRVVSEKPVVDANVIKPDLVVCFSPLEDKVALHECALAGVPTIGIIDTDVDPTRVTYPIPCNDDRFVSTLSFSYLPTGEFLMTISYAV